MPRRSRSIGRHWRSASRRWGRSTPHYAQSLNNLAELYRSQGNYAKAEPLYLQALETNKQVLGEMHPHIAVCLNNLALLYHLQGEYQKAEPLFCRALEITKQTLGEKHPDYATTLNNLAVLYKDLGDYARAEQLFRQAGEIRKQTLGEKHSAYANSLNDLALLYHHQGDYARAEPLYRQALEIRKQALGEKHPLYSQSLNNLAGLYEHQGDYARAELLYRQALEIRKQVLGEKHPGYAVCLNNLAGLYHYQGDYARAEPLYRQALEIRKQVLGEKHADFAQSLNNLAALYHDQGDSTRAEPLYRQALEINKQALGEKHPAYALSLNNLAALYYDQGDDARAEPLYCQALEIRKQVLGEKHPDYAQSVNNLAGLHLQQGDYAKAELLYRQALEITKQVLGDKHPAYATSIGNLALLYHYQGDYARAEPLYRQALEIHTQVMRDGFTALGKRQRIALQHHYLRGLDYYLSVASAAEIRADTLYSHVLTWKGAVMARQAEDRLARDQPEVKKLLDRLDQARSRLARLAFTTPPPQQRDAWLKQLADLGTEKENLESDLARVSKGFRLAQQRQHLTPAEVAAALPKETVLVDFLEYAHATPPKEGKGNLQWERRLLAFVLRGDGKLACVSLQAAGPVAEAVASWQQALAKGDFESMETAAAELHQRLWKPLQPHLGEAKTVLIAPDGVLTAFPFAALPGQWPGSYLLEDLAIGYVTSGRHAVEIFSDPAPWASTGLLAVGGVDYNAAPESVARPESAKGVDGVKATPFADSGRATPQITAKDRAGFGPLPGTELEAQCCRDLFVKAFPKDSAVLLTGAEAHAGRIKEECGKGRRYLHLATHGFFESPARVVALRAGLRQEERLQRLPGAAGRKMSCPWRRCCVRAWCWQAPAEHQVVSRMRQLPDHHARTAS